MASGDNANLFGEDTDSSDESVSASKITPSRTNDGEEKISNDDEPPKKQEAAATKTNDDENIRQDTKTNDSDEEGNAKADDAGGGGSAPGNNSALFGDDDDSSEDDEFDGDDGIVGRSGDGSKAKPPLVGKSMNEKLGLDSDSDGEKDGARPDEKEEAPKKWVPPRKMELLDLSSTALTTERKSNDQQRTYHITKLPNLVGINSTPYNSITHDMEKEEEYYRGYVHNMIRWRYKTDEEEEYVRDDRGNLVRESNTRIVKWSDGSYTLHVGQEVLEVDNLDSSVPPDNADKSMAGFAGINGYLYASQKAQIRPPTERELEGPPAEGDSEGEDKEDKTPAKPAGTVLECVGQIQSRFAPRPSSLTSDAHRNLTLAMRQRNVKRARIAEIVTEVDPEKEKMARIKGKDDLAKSRARSSGGRRGGGGGRRRGMNASYLEDEEGYDGVNLRKMKRQTMRRDRYSDEDDMEEMEDYGESSEEEEEEWITSKKRKRGAAAARASKGRSSSGRGGRDEDESSGEDGEVVFGGDDSEDEEDNAFVKKRGGGAKKAVFGDDDDD